MADKIKVTNPLRSKHTVNLKMLNGKELPIDGGGFVYLTSDELSYVRNTSKAFETGHLSVATGAALPDDLDIPESPNVLTEEDLTKLLKKPQKQIEACLAEITNIHLVQRVLEIATEQNKPVNVVELIKSRLEELAV